MSNGDTPGQDTNTQSPGHFTESLSNVEQMDEKTVEHLKSFDNLDNFVTEYNNLQTKIPQTPEKAEDYQINTPENATEQDKEIFNSFRSVAHEMGLSQNQVNKLLEFTQASNKKVSEAVKSQQDTAAKEAESKLKSEWGKDYDTNVQLAEKAVTVFGGDELVNLLESKGLTRNASIVKLFHNIATYIGEDKLVTGDSKHSSTLPTDSTGRPRLKFKSMEG